MDPILIGIAVGLLVVGIVMAFRGRALKVPEGTDLQGLKPGVAIELAGTPDRFLAIVGGGDTPQGRRNRAVLRQLQYLDFLFVLLYVALFWRLGGTESAAGFAGTSALGWGVRAAIVLTGLLDVLEDLAVLRWTRDDFHGGPIRRFGLPKWLFFFVASVGASVLFFHLAQHPVWARITGLLLAAGGLTGLASPVFRRDGLIQTGFSLVFVGLLGFIAWSLWLEEASRAGMTDEGRRM
jgi:hypothetical protein